MLGAAHSRRTPSPGSSIFSATASERLRQHCLTHRDTAGPLPTGPGLTAWRRTAVRRPGGIPELGRSVTLPSGPRVESRQERGLRVFSAYPPCPQGL